MVNFQWQWYRPTIYLRTIVKLRQAALLHLSLVLVVPLLVYMMDMEGLRHLVTFLITSSNISKDFLQSNNQCQWM
uniref:Uncharacterized protein n=1 Tax=Rhizophora mucronata TaxID=61149 RepID=A0A2P2LIQ6_RHIMU